MSLLLSNAMRALLEWNAGKLAAKIIVKLSFVHIQVGVRARTIIYGVMFTNYLGWVFALTTDPSVYGEQIIGQNTSQLEQAKQTPQLEVKVQQLKLVSLAF